MDLFETCIHIHPSLSHHYLRIAELHGIYLEKAQVERSFGSVYTRFKQDYSLLYNDPTTSKDWWHRVAYQTVTLSSAADTDTDLIKKVSIDLYEEFKMARCWRIYPDAIHFLDCCLNRGIPVAGLSNFDSRLSPLLLNMELAKYFLFVFSLAKKPDTKYFKQALERAVCEPSDSCHVGDSIREDCIPALSLGMRPVLINRREDARDIAIQLRASGVNERDVIVVNSLSELLDSSQ